MDERTNSSWPLQATEGLCLGPFGCLPAGNLPLLPSCQLMRHLTQGLAVPEGGTADPVHGNEV